MVLVLSQVSGAKNPYFDPRIVLDFNRAYLGWRLAALRRGRYQDQPGHERGRPDGQDGPAGTL